MKKITKVMLVVVGFAVLLAIYIFPRIESGNSYRNISGYIEENGTEYFVDMYNPRAYFDSTEKKIKISEIDKITVYYHADPKERYSMQFDDVIDGVDLSVVVYRDDELAEDMSTFTEKEYDNYKVYTKIGEQAHVFGLCDDFRIHLSFEGLNITKEKYDELKQIGEEIINDVFKLNL